MSVKIYDMVTQRIIDQLQNNIIPWRKPWHGNAPINFISRKPYRGINLLLLPQGGEWLTFKQCKDAGGNVRKGEKSSIIVFYSTLEKEDEHGETKTIPFLKYSNVFHISQCEGVTSKLEATTDNNSAEPIDTAQSILDGYINRTGVKYSHIGGSNRAFYQPSSDTITMPTMKQFTSIEEYYSTAFHELAHSTGHKDRLNRITKVAAFGDEVYSREELTAEISSAMIMNFTGIELPETFTNSVAYIQSWIKAIRNDAQTIVRASGQASKATDMILGLEGVGA